MGFTVGKRSVAGIKLSINFDHTFTSDQDHRFWKSLSRQGFHLEEKASEHPGQICRFIKFETLPYLEFIHASKKVNLVKAPGLSFATNSDLEALYKKLCRQKLKCTFLHRNYDRKLNDFERRPGWNFIFFKNLGFQTLFPWFTEYEPYLGKRRKLKPVKHPNGVSAIVGHEFSVNAKGRAFFSQIFKISINKKVTLKDGTVFYFKSGRQNYHSKVILNSKDLSKTKKFMKLAKEIDFHGKDALLLKNPSPNRRMWSLVITSAS